jgi:predicted acyl esterase
MKRFAVIACLLAHVLSANQIPPSKTVQIPMRDGVRLTADLYFPPQGNPLGNPLGNPSDCPCVLIRSPAGRKGAFVLPYAALSQAGYVVAIEDTRCVSCLTEFPYLSDGWGELQDGYDTVEFLEKSGLCNGSIGTIGLSAAGITQLFLAPTAPKGLKTQYIGVASSSVYHSLFSGGQFSKEQVEGWLGYYKKDPGVLSFASTQTFYNDFWKLFDTNKVAHKVNVPAFFYAGWYDVFLQGTLEAFVSRQTKGADGARGTQKLVIGPWTHFWPHSESFGDFSIPNEGKTAPIDMSPLSWFEMTLKGNGQATANIPAVTYYVMGPLDGTQSSGNVWKTAKDWPPPCKETACYLTSDQKLSFFKRSDEKVFSYVYDPKKPCPTVGGRNLFMESGPKDQSILENRDDTVVFTSETLQQDLEMTGKVVAKLFFSTDQKDTDVVVRLTDVYPDGKSVLIADGVTRLGVCYPKFICKKALEVDVDLWSTSMVFAKGHRIRIAVTSSSYPRWEVNPNVGVLGAKSGLSHIANNKILVGKDYPSRVVLPLVR